MAGTGWHFIDWTGDQTSGSFSMPASNVSITANFGANPDGDPDPEEQTVEYSDPIETITITVTDADSLAADISISIPGLPAWLTLSSKQMATAGPPSEVYWTIDVLLQ